jgi:acyl-coenzyme A synthetase/AMP-(fatty) acid ligase
VRCGPRIDDELLAACESEVTPADPMVVVYSSGSIADPKGAVHAHGPAVRHSYNLWQMRDLVEEDVLYSPMPLFWVGGFSFTLIAAMHAGATLVFEEQFEAGKTLELIEREQVTQVLGWPHMAKALVDHPTFRERDLSSIRTGSYAALLPQEQQADADVPTANSLGMTETLGPHTFDSKEHPSHPRRRARSGRRCRVWSTGSSTRSRWRSALPARAGRSGSAATPSCSGSTRRSGRRSSPLTGGTAPATPATSTRTGTSTSRAGWAT